MVFEHYSNGEAILLDILKEEGYYLSADCGGRGVCGKCRVRFLEGAPKPSEADISCLDKEELEAGVRLACMCKPEGAFKIEFEQTEEKMVAESLEPAGSGSSAFLHSEKSTTTGKALAIDIGTTTIAAALVEDGEVKKTATSVNHQRMFGADVISRIQASNEGKGGMLQKTIKDDLAALYTELGVDAGQMMTVISANTTMQHLLAGYSCETLGVAPFSPVNISLHEKDGYTFLPGISTYVGADIVSGLVNTGIDQSEKVCAFIDLGTNGEMALGNKEKILVTSTAAGPAFEGVNISCGVAGIPGAISHIDINDGKAEWQTIGDLEPVGICGSGVIDLTYELLKEGIIDETGALDDDNIDEGFNVCEGVVFTEKDVREVQLAKSAVRAGLETLIKEYGVSYDDIDKLYIAGGFGQKIDLMKCAGIGLLPKELIHKAEAVGNTSLKGAVQYIADEAGRERFLNVPGLATEVSLAESAAFQEYFIEYMYFEE